MYRWEENKLGKSQRQIEKEHSIRVFDVLCEMAIFFAVVYFGTHLVLGWLSK